MTNVRAGVKDRGDVKVERIEDPAAPKARVVDDAATEMDAEARAEQALAVQRDWQPDLSGVALHDDASARESADAIGAAAYTQGSDVYLGSAFPKGTAEGDHVLAHELGHVEQSNPPSEIHRFPATALTQGPVDWAGAVPDKPGGGISGGIYTLTSPQGQGPIDTVIVKPVFGKSGLGTDESGEQLQFGDRALSALFGISTPTSRVVNKGPEYAQIIQLISPVAPKQPEVDENAGEEEKAAAANWQPITDAKSFVVMGQVPGKSITSLVDKAATDPSAMAKLQQSVLDSTFMGEVGRLCVGDALLGNNDRMLAGAMNLGNIMVEGQEEGPAKLWAIDTNAVLGTKYNPEWVVDYGSVSYGLQGMENNLKKSSGDRRKIFDEFFIQTVARLRTAVGKLPPSEGPSVADLFEGQVDEKKELLYEAFIGGWDEGLAQVYSLFGSKEGRKKAKELTQSYEGSGKEGELQYSTLELQGRLMTSEMSGEKGEDIGTEAALKKAIAIAPDKLMPPLDDANYDMVSGPAAGALQTDYERPGVLKGHASLTNVRQGGEFIPARFDALRANVEAARAELDESIGRTKNRGLFGSKTVTRNRVLANDFVTSTYLVGAGSFRAIGSLKLLADTVQSARMGATAKISSGTAQKAIATLRAYKQKRTELDDMLGKYNASLSTASANVARLRTKGGANATFKADLSQALSAIADRSIASRTQHDKQIDTADVDNVIDTLTEKAQPTTETQKVQPSEEAKGRGRKPLIGSRGRR